MYATETSSENCPGYDTVCHFSRTGHEVIDHDHAALQDILHQVGTICHNSQRDCRQCPASQRETCTAAAVDIVTDTLKSMVEHYRHEESLLQQLTATGTKNPHAEAHSDISRRMSQLVGDYADNNTALFLHRLTETLADWLRRHVIAHDLQRVRMSHPRTKSLDPNRSELTAVLSSAIS